MKFPFVCMMVVNLHHVFRMQKKLQIIRSSSGIILRLHGILNTIFSQEVFTVAFSSHIYHIVLASFKCYPQEVACVEEPCCMKNINLTFKCRIQRSRQSRLRQWWLYIFNAICNPSRCFSNFGEYFITCISSPPSEFLIQWVQDGVEIPEISISSTSQMNADAGRHTAVTIQCSNSYTHWVKE